MATIVDSLMITLGLDPSGVDQGMKKLESNLSSNIKKITMGVLAPLAGFFTVSSLINIGQYTKTADALGKLSESMNVSVSDLDAWGQAAQSAGGSAEGFQGSMVSVNEKLQELLRTGKGAAKEVFDALKISAKDAQGNGKTVIQIMEELSEKAETFGKAEFAGLAKKLGLDQGTIMLLQSGKASVQDLVAEMKDLAYTQKDAEVAAEYNDAMQKLGKTLQATSALFLRVLVPALTVATNAFKSIVNLFRQHEGILVFAIGAVATVLTAMYLPAIKAATLATMKFLLPWLPLIALVAAVALVFEDLWVYLNGGESALGTFWASLGLGEGTLATLSKAWDGVKWAIGGVLGFIGEFAKGMIQAVVAIINAVGELIDVIWNLPKSLKRGFDAFVNSGREAISRFREELWDDFSDAFAEGFENFLVSMGEKFESFINYIRQKIAGLVSYIPDFIKPENLKKWEIEVNQTIKEGVQNYQALQPERGYYSPHSDLGWRSASQQVDNSSETLVNVGGITVNATSNDPVNIALAVSREVGKIVNTSNKGVNQ